MIESIDPFVMQLVIVPLIVIGIGVLVAWLMKKAFIAPIVTLALNMGYEFWYMKTYYEGEPISFTVWNIVFPLLSFAFGLLAVAIRKDKQHTH